jgi:hypothetical protein
MIEQIDVTVGDETMRITSLPATQALQLLAQLTKVVGGIGDGIADIATKASEVGESMHAGRMVQGLLAKIDAEEAPKLIKAVLKDSLVLPNFEGKDAEARFSTWYEDRFSGSDMPDLVTLLSAIFIHNYGDPVVWIKKGMARAMEAGLLIPSVPSSTETKEDQPTAD